MYRPDPHNEIQFLFEVGRLLTDGGDLVLRRIELPLDQFEPQLYFEGYTRASHDPERLYTEEPSLRWRVDCGRILGMKIESCQVYSLSMPKEHPAMADFFASELYFLGTPLNLDALLLELLCLNDEITTDVVSICSYFRAKSIKEIRERFEAGYGLLARGPEELLVRYNEILSRHGVKTSLLESVSFLPKMLLWNETSFVVSNAFQMTPL